MLKLVLGYPVMKSINDQKINNYKKKKLTKYLLIIASILVIILEILALFNVISMIWGLVFFIIIYLFEKIVLK